MYDQETCDKLATFAFELNEALGGISNMYSRALPKVGEGPHEAMREAIIEMFILRNVKPFDWFNDTKTQRMVWAEQIDALYNRYQQAVVEVQNEPDLGTELATLKEQVAQLNKKLLEAETKSEEKPVEVTAPEEPVDKPEEPKEEEPKVDETVKEE
jgi:hypothetical protein